MTISEAMIESKKTDTAFYRGNSTGYGGWVKYDPKWKYRHLTAEDLIADDWEMLIQKPYLEVDW